MARATAAAGAGADAMDRLAELVESALDSDDVAPLVKAVFEVAPPGEALPLPVPRGSESATTSLGGGAGGDVGAEPGNVLDAVLGLLHQVAEEKEAEIQQICRCGCTVGPGGHPASTHAGALQLHLRLRPCTPPHTHTHTRARARRAHASEIAGAVHELGALQRHTGALRQQLLGANSELQAVGTSFAARLEEVQEVAALQRGVADARQVRSQHTRLGLL